MSFLHRSLIPLRWGDLDAFGHLNNVQFFRLMEQARVEWLEALGEFPPAGMTPAQSGQTAMPVAARIECNFRQQVLYPGTLQVSLAAGRVGRSSVELRNEIRSGDGLELLADGVVVMVWVGVDSGRPVELPPAVRAAVGPPSPAPIPASAG